MRAGREPAEDVLRTLKRACRDCGLVIDTTVARLTDDRKARMVMVFASPPNWPYDSTSLVSLMTSVTVSGDVASVRILCHGTDADPSLSAFTAPRLHDCDVAFGEAAETLKTILLDRVRVGRLLAEGRNPPFFIGRWTWGTPSSPFD